MRQVSLIHMSRIEYAQICRIEIVSVIAITEEWREILRSSCFTPQYLKKPPLGSPMNRVESSLMLRPTVSRPVGQSVFE
jgi:hypothetical protein